MGSFIGGVVAIAIGAGLGAATIVGIVETQAPDDTRALQSTTVPPRTLITNDMHLELWTRICEYRFKSGQSPCVFRDETRP